MYLSVLELYERLLAAWGPQHWWPGETTIEIVVGAILTQNTAWHNVEQAMRRLRAGQLLQADRLLAAEPSVLKEAIRPAGFYNVKYGRLCSTISCLFAAGCGESRWREAPVAALRQELLAISGIGPETADSILLYAFGRPVFVVDAYTRRLLSRLGHPAAARATYDQTAQVFTNDLPADPALYNEYHALIVAQCKGACRPKPVCERCPLRWHCPSATLSASNLPAPIA